MGSACSQSVVLVGNTLEPTSRCSSPNTSCTTTTGNVLKTLVSPSIWSPFKLSRIEAEELLSEAEPGAYVFSHDIASELFLSISVGKYVCHHAVVPREHAYYVGARKFSTISDVIDFFKGHPLGETTLTEEYKAEPKTTSQVQLKHQYDNQFTIFSPATASRKPMENENCEIKSSNNKNVQNEDTKSTFLTNEFDKETSNMNIILCEAIKEERGNIENGIVNSAATRGLPQTQAASFPRRLLPREAAVDNSNVSTSSSDREIAASGHSPLITRKSSRR